MPELNLVFDQHCSGEGGWEEVVLANAHVAVKHVKLRFPLF